MSIGRRSDHLLRKINAHPHRGFKGGQQISMPASDFQDAHSRWDKKPVIVSQQFVVISTRSICICLFCRYTIPMSHAFFLITWSPGISGFPACDTHSCLGWHPFYLSTLGGKLSSSLMRFRSESISINSQRSKPFAIDCVSQLRPCRIWPFLE